MYAVFRTGGKQYRAAKGDVLRLEKIEADEGASIEFDEVLLVGAGGDVKVGNPLVAGTSVSAKVQRRQACCQEAGCREASRQEGSEEGCGEEAGGQEKGDQEAGRKESGEKEK